MDVWTVFLLVFPAIGGLLWLFAKGSGAPGVQSGSDPGSAQRIDDHGFGPERIQSDGEQRDDDHDATPKQNESDGERRDNEQDSVSKHYSDDTRTNVLQEELSLRYLDTTGRNLSIATGISLQGFVRRAPQNVSEIFTDKFGSVLCWNCARVNLRKLFLESSSSSVTESWPLSRVRDHTVRHRARHAHEMKMVHVSCVLCGILEGVINLNKKSALLASKSTGTITIRSDGVQSPSIVFVMEKEVLPSRYSIFAVATPMNTHITPSLKSPRPQVTHYTQSADFKALRGWADECLSNHPACRPRLADKDPLSFGEHSFWRRFKAPFRLYDCVEERIVYVTKEDERIPEYVALSYVWGFTTTVQLDSETQPRWMQKYGLPPRDLPLLLQDAVEIVKCLCRRYLWADKLCIMQCLDKSDTVAIKEQRRAFKVMDWIYMNAVCTIVAPEAETANARFPGSPYWRRNTLQVTTIAAGITLATGVVDPGRPIVDSLWLTRPWTFQEMICSPRTIVFTSEMALFCCGHGCRREDTREMINIEKDGVPVLQPITTFEGSLSLDDPSSQSTVRNRSRASYTAEFESLVGQYISRSPPSRDPEDWNAAFSGILAYLQPLLGDSVCGNPLEIIHNTIAWHSTTHLGRRSNEYEGRREGFPSWSWTGWEFNSSRNTFGFPRGRSALSIFGVSRTKAETPLPWKCSQLRGASHNPFVTSANRTAGKYTDTMCNYLRCDEEDLQRRVNAQLAGKDDYTRAPAMIAFFSSAARLQLRPTSKQTGPFFWKRPPRTDGSDPPPEFEDFWVTASGRRLCTIKLPWWQIAQFSSEANFVVIHCDRDRGLKLMLVTWADDIAYRVQVTEGYVSFKDWCKYVPQARREVVILG